MAFFIGRREELNRLVSLKNLQRPSLVVIKGRRRVGKSTLISEFAKGKRLISLTGIPPDPTTTAQDQRDVFSKQLCKQLNIPGVIFSSWLDAFYFLGEQITDEETVILFDEISWMGCRDHLFLGVFKIWWDTVGSLKKGHLAFILCGSISTWIQENILSSTAFYGRITLVLHLKSLSLPESIAFLKKKGFSCSIYEMLKMVCITGGIPWYLDLTDPKKSVDHNIDALCFQPAGQLVNEFEKIFHDLFGQKGSSYRRILEILVDGMKTQKEIRTSLGLQEGGTISQYLRHLILAGFISEHYQWSFNTKRPLKQKLYSLSDCFVRFHLKYVRPFSSQKTEHAWDTIMGFQLETLLLSNREFLFKALDIDPVHIVCDNPYIQSSTGRQKGCQIDYLIQTRFNSLLLCEFKFQRRELDSSITQELQAKCDALHVPKGYGKTVALFHMGGVASNVAENPFFYRVLDLRDLLEDMPVFPMSLFELRDGLNRLEDDEYWRTKTFKDIDELTQCVGNLL